MEEPGRNRPLRVGVVGSGGIAHSHLAAWRRLGFPARIHSLDPNATEVATQHGAGVAAGLDDLLAGCDVVDVCTPTPTHPEIVLAAAAGGRHVICEKPLARTHDLAVGMIDACAAAGVHLFPGQVVRYFPAYAAAQRAVVAGRIGTPAVVRLSRRGPGPAPAWFYDDALSGGLMLDQMIHDFDYARWIAGEVHTVYGVVVPGPARTVTAYALLRHTSGALSHLTGGWTGADQVFATEFSLAGSAGLLRHSSAKTSAVTFAGVGDDRAGAVIPGGVGHRSPFDDELSEFATAIRGGPLPRVSAKDSVAALDLALAARESAAAGRPVAPGEVQR